MTRTEQERMSSRNHKTTSSAKGNQRLSNAGQTRAAKQGAVQNAGKNTGKNTGRSQRASSQSGSGAYATKARAASNRATQYSRAAKSEIRSQRRGATILGIIVVFVVAAVISAIVYAFVLNTRRSAASAPSDIALVGQPAPDFSLETTNGRQVSLADFKGRKPVLLYFSEGAGCQACITQMKSIEGAQASFAHAGLSVVPIVMDSREDIIRAMKQFDVGTPFALDDGTVSKSYKTLGTGMHADLPGHGFVLIDRQGVVRWAKNYPSMRVDPQDLLSVAQTALKAHN